ncbi:Uncharacterized protein APZ42_026484 [Daphnia magna]|uniref:Uncharacterized protein n=1 Tax=Daphnia magna TaxID=35525 RepID=A0A164S842_9CRUS|nr:Uncharacterized protein APZ42_026484 [Daphnia magna]
MVGMASVVARPIQRNGSYARQSCGADALPPPCILDATNVRKKNQSLLMSL